MKHDIEVPVKDAVVKKDGAVRGSSKEMESLLEIICRSLEFLTTDNKRVKDVNYANMFSNRSPSWSL